MSLFAMSFEGTVPLGSLLVGLLASPARLGAGWTVALGGIGCVAAAAVFAAYLTTLRKLVRPVYVQRGILPEIASGMQTATQVEQVIGE